MTSRDSWITSWAEAARLFASHDAPTYATLATAFATEPEPGLPEAPLVVLGRTSGYFDPVDAAAFAATNFLGGATVRVIAEGEAPVTCT